jgi:small ligand-binding sensory domain FIST
MNPPKLEAQGSQTVRTGEAPTRSICTSALTIWLEDLRERHPRYTAEESGAAHPACVGGGQSLYGSSHHKARVFDWRSV